MGLSTDPKKKESQLSNLKPITSSDHARELQLKSAAKRAERRANLEALKVSAEDLENLGALTVMRGLVQEYLDNQDYEGASKLLGQIAEYEAPKLQRQEINQKTTVTELSDDELEAELKKLEES